MVHQTKSGPRRESLQQVILDDDLSGHPRRLSKQAELVGRVVQNIDQKGNINRAIRIGEMKPVVSLDMDPCARAHDYVNSANVHVGPELGNSRSQEPVSSADVKDRCVGR
jgi:hypothetical protein